MLKIFLTHHLRESIGNILNYITKHNNILYYYNIYYITITNKLLIIE